MKELNFKVIFLRTFISLKNNLITSNYSTVHVRAFIYNKMLLLIIYFNICLILHIIFLNENIYFRNKNILFILYLYQIYQLIKILNHLNYKRNLITNYQ